MGADLSLTSQGRPVEQRLQTVYAAAIRRRASAIGPEEFEREQASVSRIAEMMKNPIEACGDPYNNYSMLASLGMSWWDDIKPKLIDFKPEFIGPEDEDEKAEEADAFLPLEAVKWFLTQVQSRTLGSQISATSEQKALAEAVEERDGTKSSNGIYRLNRPEFGRVEDYVQVQHEYLKRLLETAIELGEPVYCSL